MNIPSIIKQQLIQTNFIIVGSWGAHKWTGLTKTTLAFRVNAHRLNGIVCVTLNEGSDMYDVSFFSNKSIEELLVKPSPKFKVMKGIASGELLYIIDDIIENMNDS